MLEHSLSAGILPWDTGEPLRIFFSDFPSVLSVIRVIRVHVQGQYGTKPYHKITNENDQAALFRSAQCLLDWLEQPQFSTWYVKLGPAQKCIFVLFLQHFADQIHRVCQSFGCFIALTFVVRWCPSFSVDLSLTSCSEQD